MSKERIVFCAGPQSEKHDTHRIAVAGETSDTRGAIYTIEYWWEADGGIRIAVEREVQS